MKLSPARRGYCVDGWPNSNPPCSDNFFSFFFFLPFSKAILKPAELSSLRNIVSSLYQLFVHRFAMAVFMCIYLHYDSHQPLFYQIAKIERCVEYASIATCEYALILRIPFIVTYFTEWFTYNFIMTHWWRGLKSNLDKNAHSALNYVWT